MDMSSLGKFDIVMVNLSTWLPLSQLLQMRIDMLCDKGFIFVWIEPSNTNPAYTLLQHWGYEVIDQLVWVLLAKGELAPTDTPSANLFKSSFRHCLVGLKNSGPSFDYSSKVSNNLIFRDGGRLPP
jgi:N6-adenosine-specific RNA methylase IME4